jgi:hypothetical protein
MVGWPRGEAQDCKSCYTGSNPVPTSIIYTPYFTKSWGLGAKKEKFTELKSEPEDG